MRLTLSERRRIVANMIRKPSGRAQLAEAMKEPLRNYRDYEAVGRRAFMVDPLEPGQLAYYDKDIDVPAWVVSEDGQDVLCIVKGSRVSVGLFEIATNPMIPITQIFQRKFDLEARVKAKTKAEIFRKEDTKIFSMLLAMVQAGTHPNPVIPVDVSATPVTIDHFSEAMSLIESHGNIRCANIFMNPGNMKILRALGKDYFEPAITNELLRTGFVGTIMGCQIHTTPVLSSSWIVFTGEPEFFGVIPVMQDLTVLPCDDTANRMVGFSIWQQIGCYAHNPAALAAIQLT